MGTLHYFLGVQVKRNCSKGILNLSQTSYMNKLLQQYHMDTCKPVSTPMVTGIKLSNEMNPKTIKKKLKWPLFHTGMLLAA